VFLVLFGSSGKIFSGKSKKKREKQEKNKRKTRGLCLPIKSIK
jgi:hypothetical protein